ncbi:peptidylprolyl isomerase [bacterium]|nr:peptidylprolyl isomerase [bacterium]
MAVMQNMREYTKVVLIILVLAFVGTIIFDWGMDVTGLQTRQGVIGEVNGSEISAKQFDDAFARELQAYRDRTGQDINENQTEYIRNQVWESMIQGALVQQAIKERGIYASDEEIVYRLFEDPPEMLKASFLNEQNEFDMARYQSALKAPGSGGQWKYVEDILRQTLPGEKFQQRLSASVRVTENEIQREYTRQNQKVKVKYIFFDPNRFSTDDAISDAGVKAYYDENKEEFREEEKRKIDYVVFSTEATEEDSATVWENARSYIERTQKGEDFAELAQNFSEDPNSRDKGGDLGFFGAGAMVKPFEEAAFGAKLGEIVGPVKSSFGLHIIKVEDKRIQDGKEEVRARHILLKFEASSETESRAREDAMYLAEEATNRPFEEVVRELNQEIQTTGSFGKGSGFIPGLGLHRRASNFAFANRAGKVSGAEQTTKGYFVFRIAETLAERIPPVEEVKPRIVNTLKQQRNLDQASQLAQALYLKTQGGASFEDAASQDSLEVKQTDSFTRTGYVSGVGREPQFIGTAFALENVGDVSGPVSAVRGFYLLQLVEKDEIDLTDYEEKKSEIAQQLVQRRQSQAFANWYADAKAKADIKDFRDKYYN